VGALRPPPDKSISHRAALIAAIGEGGTAIEGFLDAADTRSTLRAVRALGAGVGASVDSASTLPRSFEIEGVGLRGAVTGLDIDVGNAGTLLRLLPGWLAGQETGRWTIDGDESIRRRPVDRVAEPLRLMGATIECRDGRLPPIRLEGSPLSGISYRLPMASAQVKSCLLLAGLLAEGETRVIEPAPTRDHTERMLAAAGAEVGREGDAVTVRPADRLEPGVIVVPGDLSSAAFFLVAATIIPGSSVRLEGVGLNPTRSGLLSVLRRMGAAFEVAPGRGRGGEPVGVITASATRLRGTRVEGDEIPLAIDELPLIALAACFADGETVIAGAEELRRKESDRIATVTEALAGLGATIEATADGMVITGGDGLAGGTVRSHGDHRIAMLGAIAGLASERGVEVDGIEAAAVSYPGFGSDLAGLRGR
jgi:3-phosphoshikimate 1-carboxyvinyltransferase